VRVISRRKLRDFYTKYPDSKSSLDSWFYEAKKAFWKNPAEIKENYRNASFLEDNKVCFNISGNKYRLIVKVNYRIGIVFIRFIGTHSQYDKIDVDKV